MQQNVIKTHLAHSIEKTEYETQYDENVKVLLSDKQVLARIAKHRTEEFKDYDISTIIECIEGEPEISAIPLYPGYHFEPRAVFYCARMISEQLDHEFTTDNYGGLKKVYSIWIFFEAPERDSDTITEYQLTKKDIYGRSVEGGKYDYLSISFIRLSTGKKKNSKDKLINMLDTLFSHKIDAVGKKVILENEHQMKMTRELEEDVETIRNLIREL